MGLSSTLRHSKALVRYGAEKGRKRKKMYRLSKLDEVAMSAGPSSPPPCRLSLTPPPPFLPH